MATAANKPSPRALKPATRGSRSTPARSSAKEPARNKPKPKQQNGGGSLKPTRPNRTTVNVYDAPQQRMPSPIGEAIVALVVGLVAATIIVVAVKMKAKETPAPA